MPQDINLMTVFELILRRITVKSKYCQLFFYGQSILAANKVFCIFLLISQSKLCPSEPGSKPEDAYNRTIVVTIATDHFLSFFFAKGLKDVEDVPELVIQNYF